VVNEEGIILSSAENYCGKDEERWSRSPEFQIRSMAQTRACAKALRNIYAWIVVMAGFEGTPADEIDEQSIKIELNECSICKAILSKKVKAYSIEKYKVPLCISCQGEKMKNE